MVVTSALFFSVTDITTRIERSEPNSSIQKRNADARKAIQKKCFVSHRPPSREGGSVGRAKKKRNEHMKGFNYKCQ